MLAIYSLIRRNQTKVINEAAKSNAIVASLFPAAVRERLFNQANALSKKDDGSTSFMAPSRRLKSYLSGDDNSTLADDNETPIADLFPYCTVMFADIAGR